MQHFWGESNTFLRTMPTIGECRSDGFSAALSPTCHILLPSITKIFIIYSVIYFLFFGSHCFLSLMICQEELSISKCNCCAPKTMIQNISYNLCHIKCTTYCTSFPKYIFFSLYPSDLVNPV